MIGLGLMLLANRDPLPLETALQTNQPITFAASC